MRKLLLSLILAGVFVLPNASFSGETCICSTHYYIVEPVKLMPVLLKHYRELKLTERQREEIKQLIHLIKERIIPLDRRIDRLSEKVRSDMLRSDSELLVEGEMRVLANLKVERSLYNYKCIKGLKKILSEEQFNRLLQMAGY